MRKKVVVHVIDSLGLGGAEILLVNTVRDLDNYENHVIFLSPQNDLKEALQCQTHCLYYRGKQNFLGTVYKLRKLLKALKPDILHTHLYWSTVMGRLACIRKTKLISSYHSLLYDKSNKAQYSPWMLLLDKLTYRRKYFTLFVSAVTRQHLSQTVGINSNRIVLNNFVEPSFFQTQRVNRQKNESLRLISVGNLRREKGYVTLLKAIKILKTSGVELSLDIFGEGTERKRLQEEIDRYKLPVRLMGRHSQVSRIYADYDLYVMASTHEGFGIALAEAMATGIPCVVSDIPAFKEIAQDTVWYFEKGSPEDLADTLIKIAAQPELLEEVTHQVKNRALNFEKRNYLKQLNTIYEQVTA